MRKALLILTFITLTFRINAQEIEWQNTIGGSLTDYLYNIKVCVGGGYICGGSSESNISGDKTQNAIGEADYWVVRLDSSGNIQWQKTIGGNGIDNISTILQTSDGGFVCGGWSDSNISGDKTENSQGGSDYWIVKLDMNGIIQWQNTIGGNGLDFLNSIEQTSDGGYICGGSSNSGISGDKSENTNGLDDYWIVKIDSLGNIQWENTVGGLMVDRLNAIQQTFDGGYICGGTSDSDISGDKLENSRGIDDFWVIKLDMNGSLQWQKTIGGNDYDLLHCLRQTMDGGYICGGESISSSSGEKSENSQGGYDFWVVKLDTAGNIQWQNTIGGDGFDGLQSIKSTNNGGYICGGMSSSNISGDKFENSIGGLDYWVVKLDNAGQLEWQNTIGGLDNDWLNLVESTSASEYICGGWSESNISGDKTENSNGYSDYWIVKITNNYNLIHGKTYADLNSNQTQEPSEPSIPYLKITENNSNRFTFSQSNGFYSLAVVDSGNFEVAPDYLNLYNPVPLTHTGNFSSFQQVDSLNDFAFQPSGTFNDLCISISPLGNFRSGFNANYALNYSNLGTTTLIPTIVFYPDNNVSFVSASITPTTITPDSVVFVLGTMNPFQNGQITITVNVNTGLPIGTLINSGAMILTITNDANPGCNSSYWEVFTIGSYDPNDIIVNREFIYDYEMPAPPELEYIIDIRIPATILHLPLKF